VKVLALFGPTAVGKTGVAIALGERLRERGEDPVAVNCDSIQIYRGLELLSGAASEAERARLEHRLLSFVDPSEEFSAGRYAELAHAEIDALLEQGRRPIVVGGTGLYLRAALSALELRPAVPAELREQVEAELERNWS
jgi:tRNA dimethylallyltransferase